MLPIVPLVVPSLLQSNRVLNRKAKNPKVLVAKGDRFESLTITCSGKFTGRYSVLVAEPYNTKTDISEVKMARLIILFGSFQFC